MPHHVPHSEVWFTQLMAMSPHQASATRAIIKSNGSDDVCSVCGDEDPKDYLLDGESFPDGKTMSLRLCDGCKQIRTAMYGESFSAI